MRMGEEEYMKVLRNMCGERGVKGHGKRRGERELK
jgi:hypothetical protein